MKLSPQNIYHIYNRGNNKQIVFFNRGNYMFFIKKMRSFLKPHVDFLAYCLMPNHFHFLLKTPVNFNPKIFGNEFKIMLSSYTQAINNQEKRSGSLFQQNSKSKCLSFETTRKNSTNYALICFNYIHQNPYKSGSVTRIEEWEFSSFKDYVGLRSGSLCNKELAYELLDLPCDVDDLYKFSYSNLSNKNIEKIF